LASRSSFDAMLSANNILAPYSGCSHKIRSRTCISVAIKRTPELPHTRSHVCISPASMESDVVPKQTISRSLRSSDYSPRAPRGCSTVLVPYGYFPFLDLPVQEPMKHPVLRKRGSNDDSIEKGSFSPRSWLGNCLGEDVETDVLGPTSSTIDVDGPLLFLFWNFSTEWEGGKGRGALLVL
jgi:hypothetical protein